MSALWDTVFESIQPYVEADPAAAPEQIIRSTFRTAWQVWLEHPHVFRALADNWNTDPDLQVLWVSIVDRFTTAIAAEIERERANGAALPGPDPRELASVLLWSTAHCLHVAGTAVDPHMPSESSLFDTMMTVWLRSIYGHTAEY